MIHWLYLHQARQNDCLSKIDCLSKLNCRYFQKSDLSDTNFAKGTPENKGV